MPHATLTPEQIQFFKTEGYVVIEGLIEPAYLDQWRQRVWAEIGGTPEDPSTWKNKTGSPRADFEPQSLRFHRHPGVSAIVDQLGGGKFVCGHDSCVTTWPTRSTAWAPYTSGHLDGYNASIGWWPFMLSATTYLYDAPAMSGAMTLWPRSHINAWRYFRQKPHQIAGDFLKDPSFNEAIYHADQPPGREATARAGDVIFWHAFIVHNGSMNVNTLPRIGFFTRWQHENQHAIKYEVPDDLWKYWAI